MAIDPGGPQANLEHRGAMPRTVGDEMAAIFGSNSRGAMRTRLVNQPANARSATPRRVTLAALVGLVATVLTAGLYTGNSVSVTPVATPAPQIANRILRSTESLDIRSPSVVKDVTTLPSVRPSIAPNFERRPRPTPGATATVDQPRPVPALAARDVAPSIVPNTSSPTPVPTSTPTSKSSPASSSATMPPPSCVGSDSECLAQHFDLAEQLVADAYERAVSAGVGRRALHRSRIALDGARMEIAGQPRYALRLYGVVASDLDGLADKAAASVPTRAR